MTHINFTTYKENETSYVTTMLYDEHHGRWKECLVAVFGILWNNYCILSIASTRYVFTAIVIITSHILKISSMVATSSCIYYDIVNYTYISNYSKYSCSSWFQICFILVFRLGNIQLENSILCSRLQLINNLIFHAHQTQLCQCIIPHQRNPPLFHITCRVLCAV